MAKLDKLLGAGLVGLLGYGIGCGIYSAIKNNAENKRRINTPCVFNNGITQSEFSAIAEKYANKI